MLHKADHWECKYNTLFQNKTMLQDKLVKLFSKSFLTISRYTGIAKQKKTLWVQLIQGDLPLVQEYGSRFFVINFALNFCDSLTYKAYLVSFQWISLWVWKNLRLNQIEFLIWRPVSKWTVGDMITQGNKVQELIEMVINHTLEIKIITVNICTVDTVW